MYKVPETYWTEGKNKSVTCLICPHGCVIRPDGTGICRTRTNREGYCIRWLMETLVLPE